MHDERRSEMSESNWDSVEKQVDDKRTQTSLFLRLEDDGEFAVVAFLGQPMARSAHFVAGRGYECTGPGCARCAETERNPSLRVLINCWIVATGLVRIFEMAATTFKDVARLRRKYPSDEWLFTVTRHGARGDAVTTYSVVPARRFTEGERDLLAKVELHDLDRPVREDGPAVTRSPRPTATIDPRLAAAIDARLRGLPATARARVLDELGVRALRELPAADEPRAIALLARETEAAGFECGVLADPFE
jgi:hypothetical protein